MGEWGKIKIKDHLSPAEAETGAELRKNLFEGFARSACSTLKKIPNALLKSVQIAGYKCGPSHPKRINQNCWNRK